MALSACLGMAIILAPAYRPAIAADDAKAELEGTWQVVSVEMAGQDVPGLGGSDLTLAPGGRKTFKLSSGVVEKGTYKLDTKTKPSQIDSTTDGKPGMEKGVYKVEGDTLTL